MMKKIYTLGMILMIGQMAFAQFSHNFTMERTAMIDLQNPTDVTDRGLLTDLEGESVKLGFDFNFGGTVIADGLRFAEDGMLEAFDVDDESTVFTLSPMMGVDLVDRGINANIQESRVSYELMGSPGNYKFVIQWMNVGFQQELDEFNTTDDYLNFQLVLNQATSKIEYIYGRSRLMGTNSYFQPTGPMIGLASDKLDSQLFLYKYANNPKTTSQMANLIKFPINGTSYAFVPESEESVALTDVRVAQTTKLDVKIYPNPCANEFNIQLLKGIPSAKILVRSPYGKVVFEGSVRNTVNVDLAGLDPGLYVVEISDNTSSIIRKVMKR